MNDNIFVRIYGDDAPYLIETGDYTSINQPLMAIAMQSTQLNTSENRNMLKDHYEKCVPIIITEIGYHGIKQLHKMIGSDATLGYMNEKHGYHCEAPKMFGYYGIVKNADGDIKQLYYELEENNILISENIIRGLGVDETSQWLNINMPLPQNEGNIKSKYNLLDAENDLTQISSAQNMTFRVPGEKYGYYNDGSGGTGVNSFAINITIYSAHSNVDNSDYYYIEQEGVYNFNNQYKGQYKYNYSSSLSKVEEFYCSNLVTDCYLGVDKQYLAILRLAPPTTEGKTTITSGLSWSLGGSATVNQDGVAATINGGISVNNSRSVTVDNVSVFNRSADNGINAKWEYVLKKTESKFAIFDYGEVALINASNTGHSTFVPFNHWIWRVLPKGRPQGDTIRLYCNLALVMTSSRGYLKAPFYTDISERNHNFTAQFILDFKQAPLPVVTNNRQRFNSWN